MAGYIAEFFGYSATDNSPVAASAAKTGMCPFISAPCAKELRAVSGPHTKSGACSIRQVNGKTVICCPNRLYAQEYRFLRDVAYRAFGVDLEIIPGSHAATYAINNETRVVAAFGHRWGKELRLPKKDGAGPYFVDWVLALISADGQLVEFVAVEVQAIDTTGNYQVSRTVL